MERGSSHLPLMMISVFFWVLFSWVYAYMEVYYVCFTRCKLSLRRKKRCGSEGGNLNSERHPQRGARGRCWLAGEGGVNKGKSWEKEDGDA